MGEVLRNALAYCTYWVPLLVLMWLWLWMS